MITWIRHLTTYLLILNWSKHFCNIKFNKGEGVEKVLCECLMLDSLTKASKVHWSTDPKKVSTVASRLINQKFKLFL